MSSDILHAAGPFNNSPDSYAHIQAIPLSAAMGAEIAGVDIRDLNDEAFLEVKDALFKHKMIYFRDQKISQGQQEQFTLRFGEFGVDAYTTGSDEHKNVQPVIKEAETTTKMVFGSGWHTDSPFLATPPSISMLYGVDVPPWGGDTIWCNAALAYQALSSTMQQIIAPLKVHMSASEVVNVLSEMNAPKSDKPASKEPGEKSLYVDQTYSRGIAGMTEQEATPILDFLVRHLTQPVFSCRLRWRNNTFAMWDNRLCVHQAFNDYDGFRREMYRTTVLGEKPA